MKSDILNKNINQILTDLNQVKTATELIGDDWVVALMMLDNLQL